jgi:hypothetical protein
MACLGEWSSLESVSVQVLQGGFTVKVVAIKQFLGWLVWCGGEIDGYKWGRWGKLRWL